MPIAILEKLGLVQKLKYKLPERKKLRPRKVEQLLSQPNTDNELPYKLMLWPHPKTTKVNYDIKFVQKLAQRHSEHQIIKDYGARKHQESQTG
jgi:hypothetical protein